MGPTKTIGVDLWAGQARGGQNLATCYRAAPRQARRSRCTSCSSAAYTKFAIAVPRGRRAGPRVARRRRVDRRTGGSRSAARARRSPRRRDRRPPRSMRSVPEPPRIARAAPPRDRSRSGAELAAQLTTVRYRVLDLRTEGGFTDEDGKRDARPARGRSRVRALRRSRAVHVAARRSDGLAGEPPTTRGRCSPSACTSTRCGAAPMAR